MMLREIFSMISPFRGHSRARRSAAFGGADETEVEDEQSNEELHPTQTPVLEDLKEDVDSEDRMIEDAGEGVAQTTSASRKHLDIPSSSRPASRSPSPRPRSSLPAPGPPKSLPLADSALVTPGLRRHVANVQPDTITSTPGPSTSYAPPPQQTSPVSRNYDLLARFFSEKQRGGQGGLTEVEVEGCIRLIEESMATGCNLESEFIGAPSSSYGRQYPSVQTPGFAPSSRASSLAPSSAMPATQSMNNLFHPGTNRMPASSSAYSFLAPRAAVPQSSRPFGASASSAPRRRPIYLGPGISGLSLNRRRPVEASASRAAALARTQAQGFMPKSSTDPNLARHARNEDDITMQDASDRAAGIEDAKRRRKAATADIGSPAQSRTSTANQTVQFDPTYENQARQSSLLAKNIVASSSSTTGASVSPLKRAAPTAEPAKTSPPKVPTRTANAIQDILKSSPPVRPPTKPELVNPYQSVAPLPSKSKRPSDDEVTSSTPARRSARASMLTRAKARETAKAAEKNSPPKESVLELIERTAPKAAASKRKATSEVAEDRRNGNAPTAPSPAAPAASARADASVEEQRKLQKTEEVQRRLEALNKAKTDQQAAAKPAIADASRSQKAAAPSKSTSAANLVPPQYTSTKPKKPSPLSAAFQAPESPSSDSESSPAQPRGPAIAQPSFDFGSSSSSTATAAKPPSASFSFSAPKPSAAAPAAAAPALASSSGSFAFSKPAASAAPAAPASAPYSTFSFSPVTPTSSQPPSQPKPATTTSSSTFSFSAPATAPALAPTSSAASASSPRSEVLAEGPSKLPKFDWQVPAPSTSAAADKALRDEIKSVAETALPKFDFVYDVDIAANSSKKTQEAPPAAPSKSPAPAPSAGFSFSALSPTPAPAQPAAASSEDAADSSDDPSKTQSSGLLGEGEGEESESSLHEARAKIWSLDPTTKSWKDLGVCIAKLKHNSDTGKHRLLARNEANGKVAVNFMTYKGLKTKLEGTVNSFLGFDGKEPTTYRVKVKTEDAAKEFKAKLESASA
ncbi:hypothetical protein NDA16_000237 [Ustilago loliicola]|nr:hypothetical protein NDA16_000237 [Ustilago loliicola]